MSSRIVFNAGVMLCARMVNLVINFLLIPFMLMRLGTEAYGVLVLATSFSLTSGLASLLDFGIQTALIVFVAGYLAKKEFLSLSKLASTAVVVYALLGILAGLGLFTLSDWLIVHVFKLSESLESTAVLVFQIMAAYIFVEFLGAVPLAVLEGDQKYKITRGIITLGSLLRSLGIIIVLFMGFGVVEVIYIYLIEVFITYGLMTYVMFRQFPDLSIKPSLFSKTLLLELVKFGKPIFGQKISGLLFRQADRFVVASLLSVKLVAHYNIIQSLYRYAMAFQSFSPVVVPAASSALAENDMDSLRNMFIQNTKYATALTSMIAVTTALLMQPLLLYWVGNEFVYLTPLAQVFVLMAVGASAIAVGQSMMTPLGRAKDVMIFGLIVGSISLFGSFVTVSKWQLIGIVWTTLLGAFVGWVLNLTLARKELALNYRKSLMPLFIRSYSSIIIVGLLSLAAIRVRIPESLFEVFVYGTIAMLAHATLFYCIGLDSNERLSLRSKLQSMFSKRPISEGSGQSTV